MQLYKTELHTSQPSVHEWTALVCTINSTYTHRTCPPRTPSQSPPNGAHVMVRRKCVRVHVSPTGGAPSRVHSTVSATHALIGQISNTTVRVVTHAWKR